MRHVIVTGLASLVLLCSPAAVPAGSGAGIQVCPPLDTGKIDTTGEPLTVTVTAPEGYAIGQVCVKAGSVQQGDGPEFLVSDGATTLTFGHSSGKAVSHWSASFVPTGTEPVRPEPTPTPDPEPAPEPEPVETAEPSANFAAGGDTTSAVAPVAPAARPVAQAPSFTG